jgi:membrane protease YdiL (CAAX protease family)
MITAVLLLTLCIAEMVYFVRNDRADYSAFKLLSKTLARRQRFRVWIIKSFFLFSGTSLVALTLLHRLTALFALPPEFVPIAAQLHQRFPDIHLNSGFLVGFIPAVLIGGVAGGILFAKKSASKVGAPALGDVEHLMPRNWPETVHTAALSLNAGLSEELYFRLLLPLLLISVTGNAFAAFLVAALLFGAVHAYQGVVGVLATTVLGAVFTAIYLATGTIWIPIALHATLDLIGLVVRPTIVRLLRSS